MITSDPAKRALADAPVWCADRADGTYENPVLFADYSDPDAIRVGSDYWLTSSSFSHVPGLPILHSRDLVNWTLVNHALPRLVPADYFSRPRHGQGVWAPALRHHGGKFWIFYPDPDFGIYAITANDPRERWSEPTLVKAGKGLIDPCPFWDDDGTSYLIHGWAKSRSGINNRLTLHRLRNDHLRVADEGVIVVDGAEFEGWHTIEGPKLYRRAGYYYIFAPAGGVRDGYQAVFRARSLYGPYEERIVLARGATPINGPHQGAWVDTPAGEHWFLHFQEMPAYGRVVHLQPMQWQADWPIVGRHRDGNGTGEPVPTHRKPIDNLVQPAGPATSDDFNDGSLGMQWQWQANPQENWAQVDPAQSALKLACVAHAARSLWLAPHLLLQKFPAPTFQATADLQLDATTDGSEAGLIVFGYDYAWLGLRVRDGQPDLVLVICRSAHEGGIEQLVFSRALNTKKVWLRASVRQGARCEFAYSDDGHRFTAVGEAFQCCSSHWVGAKIGLFASARSTAVPAGGARIDRFEIAPLQVSGGRADRPT